VCVGLVTGVVFVCMCGCVMVCVIVCVLPSLGVHEASLAGAPPQIADGQPAIGVAPPAVAMLPAFAGPPPHITGVIPDDRMLADYMLPTIACAALPIAAPHHASPPEQPIAPVCGICFGPWTGESTTQVFITSIEYAYTQRHTVACIDRHVQLQTQEPMRGNVCVFMCVCVCVYVYALLP
jgi:hypothetical protein